MCGFSCCASLLMVYRYRLTALFLTSLLMGRLLFPHTLLSAFIAVNARVEPDDSPLTWDRLVRAGHERLVHGLRVYDPVAALNNGQYFQRQSENCSDGPQMSKLGLLRTWFCIG